MRRWIIIAVLCGSFLGLLAHVMTSPAPQPVRVIPSGGHVYYPTVVPYTAPKGRQPTKTDVHPTSTPRP
ncbi:hypothetical protein KDA_75080 [Dictyobacter alpinus]|uniref:Uncharacterized protein n=1 Tax=Dictyobacter alpinus TaxID=2014873 RepID=A0A402BL01_9CHLR|nr:hypothetical protein [Dictyobacter alpinus]GCE32024.1 hypothetical protein KDA_75080 [Dictyobacter alpinus]